MKISYFGLQSDIIEIMRNSVENTMTEDVLYVFSNYQSMKEVDGVLKKSSTSLFPSYAFMSETDFYEHLFKTDRILLKEEKEVILFYKSLDKKTREELNINSYFDVIDIAYNYYGLFSELQEYKVNIDEIKFDRWQLKIFNTMNEIHNNFQKECDKRRFVVKHMLRDVNNIDYNFLNKYKKIIFINKLKFTPFEKELYEIINKQKDLEIYLQIEESDFNEESLKLKQITFPETNKLSGEIKIKEAPNKFVQLLELIGTLNEEQSYIYDADDINTDDYQLLNQSKLSHTIKLSLNKTKIYEVIELLSNILKSATHNKTLHGQRTQEIIFSMNSLLEAFKNECFKKKYSNHEGVFQVFARENYKYLSAKEVRNKADYKINLLKEKNKFTDDELAKEYNKYEKLAVFLEEMEVLLNIKSYKDYISFLENLADKDLGEQYYIKDRYLEALSEIVTIEDFNFDGLWDKFFDDMSISGNLLKLFLKYLDKKDFSLIIEKDEGDKASRINSLDSISEINKESIYLFNLQGSLPKVRINNFLLTKPQRAELGLPTKEDEKLINSFIFYKNIFSAKKVTLSYIKNLDEKIESSSLVAEIILKYNLQVETSEISEDVVLNIIKGYFDRSKEGNYNISHNEFIKSDLLKPEIVPNISLGYYDYEALEKCQYRYFLDSFLKIENIEEITTIFDLNSFGSVIHKIFEEVMSRKKDDIEMRNNFSISEEEIRDELEKILNQSIYVIPRDYLEFYKKVSFESIVKAVVNFFNLLSRELLSSSTIEIVSEQRVKQKKETQIDPRVFINGIMDLHIKSDDKEIYVDYKSGNLSKDDKIEKALKQLDYYELMEYGGKNERVEKWIIDAWNGNNVTKNYNRKEKFDTITMENLKEIINSYFQEKKYLLADKITDCMYCKYVHICRRGDEIE